MHILNTVARNILLYYYMGNDLFENWKRNMKYIDEDDIMKYVDTVMEEHLPKK